MYFKPQDRIDNELTVIFPIKKGAYAETYRVKDQEGNRYFFKLIDPALLQKQQIDADGSVREIKILEELDHPNLPKFIKKGELHMEGTHLKYVMTDLLSSETLADRLIRSDTLSVYDTKEIAFGLLSALQYLHGKPDPIIHNEVTALNVLVDLSTEDLQKVRLIDFGYARHLYEANKQNIDGLNWFYLAPERFEGSCTQQSDLYSVGALMYQLIFGMLPWFCDLSAISPDRREQYLLRQKKTELPVPNMQKFELDENLLNVLRKAMAANMGERFQTADEFIEALKGNISVVPPKQTSSTATGRDISFSQETTPTGNGFDDVAGMEEMKQMLKKTVLNILKDTDKAKKYKLQIPNGMLFYGPPGCGKSFFAEKFAEEAGYNFKLIKASDLASIYVHGSQEKIGALFDEARKNAPTILCFDEFDALVPVRGKVGTEHQAGEVNEFLTQLNNCGKYGVFVIASTNRPDMIDPAVLRRGRIDKIIYIPIPDKECRAAMFEMHLKGRPYDSNIDCQHLASLTENYIASDIAFVVNEAAARAAFSDAKISSEMLEEVISANKPSLTPSVINGYMKMREKMEGIVEERKRIGF